MTLKTRNLLASAICLLALSRIFGFILDLESLGNFGRSIAFAPLPIPFRAIDEFEDYVVANKVLLRRMDGGTTEYNINSEIKKQMSGPHRYKAVSYNLFGWGPKLPYRLIEPVFQELFCRGRYDNIWGNNVAGATIFYYSKRSGIELARLTYHCHD